MLGLQVCNNREVIRLNPILRIQKFRRKEAQEVFHQDPRNVDNEEHQEKMKMAMFDEVFLALGRVAVHIVIATKVLVKKMNSNETSNFSNAGS
jgi:hypothetical protein